MRKIPINTKKVISWSVVINGLTISRIFLGLPILITLNSGNNDIFILLMIIAAFTDFLDGYFARKHNLQSVVGAKLDPLADKIVIIAPMIWLVHESIVPVWAIWLIISRELLITSWRSEKASGGPASIQGKFKTSLQFLSIILLLWPNNWGTNIYISIIKELGFILFWVSLFITLSSAINYVFNQKVNHQS